VVRDLAHDRGIGLHLSFHDQIRPPLFENPDRLAHFFRGRMTGRPEVGE